MRALLVLAALAALVTRGLADAPAACRDDPGVGVLASPAAPRAGAPLRLVVAADDGRPGTLTIDGPSGPVADAAIVVHEGMPWSAVATIAEPVAGRYRIRLERDGGGACHDVEVAGTGAARAPAAPARPGVWPVRLEWNRATEALYAAWVAHLFAAPPDAEPSFPSLEPVLRDPARNFLFDHLGLGEDGPGQRALRATPDCADLPYLLRAYFAWKVGLPAGFRRCDRGSATTPPRCGPPLTSEATTAAGGDSLAAFVAFARTLADAVHSGSARTALADDATDYYPVPLTRAGLRPGTVYTDPYGHTLVVVDWVPQTAERPGLLLAVDAQPDHTVARKRFWEGTFLFADVPGAGPGFKAFRPLVHDGGATQARPLSNAALAHDPRFTPWSGEQATLDPDAFYARVGALVNPNGLEPERAYDATLDALVEQLETRAQSIDNAERFAAAHPGTVIPMPEGAAIFETQGDWEDYSTPSRDLRLVIAMNVLAALPARVVHHPELFVLGDRSPEAARADVERLHAERVGARSITYTRSDGSPWQLTVAQVLERKPAFEVGYDPNDCVEVRWGAVPGTPEAGTCRRRAPAEQRARMEGYREWFRDARRPPR